MIRFYKVSEKYGEFSNFSPYEVVVLGMVWKTSEHYFQARKFQDSSLVIKVMDAPTPMEAANIGRDRSYPIREDWDTIKLEVMKEVILAKFTQNENLKELLLSTGSEKIVEASPYDYFWGEGADGSGKNYLGRILMEAREDIRKTSCVDVIAPWTFNSDAEPYDFFWSQGEAEDVAVNWYKYVKSLSNEELEQYFAESKIPENWRQWAMN
ncbi:NADAR family protein [Pseudoalteromonas porphyrae]|uniref:NADAR family protein n=1 Tax=Pseudoalteromonas porphyrae TaxID=187330 RepID=UPI0009EAD776|nr:NADAR family protein [Pseudoalteromonas porphyrae]